MQVSQKIIDEINAKPFSLSSRNAVVGLDGFVDKTLFQSIKDMDWAISLTRWQRLRIWEQKFPLLLGKVPISNCSQGLKNLAEMDQLLPMLCYHWNNKSGKHRSPWSSSDPSSIRRICPQNKSHFSL